MPAEVQPPADWYRDPEDPTRARYWDGHSWSDLRAELPGDGDEVAEFAGGARSRADVRPSRHRRPAAIAVAAVAIIAVGVALVIANRPDPDVEARVAGTSLLRVRGGLDLILPSLVGMTVGEPCRGSGPFAEVGPDTRIEVRDQGNRRVASTPLGAGHTVVDPDGTGPYASLMVVCRFEYVIEVPDLDTYRIGVAGFGTQRYQREEIAERGWRIELALGP